MKSVFGKEKMKKLTDTKIDLKERMEQLSKPKDKWKRGRELLELKK